MILLSIKSRHKQKETIRQQALAEKQLKKNTAVFTNSNSNKQTQREQRTLFITFKLNNIEHLFQQLSAESQQQQLLSLQNIITHGTQLYGGKKHLITHDSITLCFTQVEDIMKVVFAGQLILLHHQRHAHAVITLSALIHENLTDETLLQCLDYNRKANSTTLQQAGLFIQHHLAHRQSLAKKTQLEACSAPHLLHITQLQENHQKLIENQLKQLQQ
jgi:hypothetical protein